MELKLIFEGKATIDDMERLHKLGYEFIIQNGKVTQVFIDRGRT